MTSQRDTVPSLLPVLSVGRHRRPRSGACFMEFASFLAGERWSDHPSCTHPALAYLARLVNDCTSDRARSHLVELIPEVIGVLPDDPRTEALLALRVATAALPIASAERQRALAVGILSCEHWLDRLGSPADDRLSASIRGAFDQAPHAEAWARQFVGENTLVTRPRAASRMTESVIRVGVLGIAQACTAGADARLRGVLSGAIDECRALMGVKAPEPVSLHAVASV